MSRTLSEQQARQYGLTQAGNAKSITKFDGKEVTSDDETTVWSKQVPADALFAHGAGSDDRNSGRTAFIYADVVADGSGTGTAGDQIKGDLEAVITDSRQRDVLGRYRVGDLDDLAEAEASSRTDRPRQPAVYPPAREDRHLELRITADSDSDGAVIDPAASSVRLYYTDIDN